MNLTPKRFMVAGVESDLEVMRRNVALVQADINKASKLLKYLLKVEEDSAEIRKYLEDTNLTSVYEQAKAAAKDLSKAQYKQFVQDGGLANILGGLNGAETVEDIGGADSTSSSGDK